MKRSGKTHKRNRAEESLDNSFTLSPYRNRLSCGPDYIGPLTLRISDLSTTVALSDPKSQTNNTKTFLSSSLTLQQPRLDNLKNCLKQMEEKLSTARQQLKVVERKNICRPFILFP